jgi:hypothetical protein
MWPRPEASRGISLFKIFHIFGHVRKFDECAHAVAECANVEFDCLNELGEEGASADGVCKHLNNGQMRNAAQECRN